MKFYYTLNEILFEMNLLKHTFQIVRLIEPFQKIVIDHQQLPCLADDNEIHCHAIWKRDTRCPDCVSSNSMMNGVPYSKFDYIDDKIYFVLARVISLNCRLYVLETATEVNDGSHDLEFTYDKLAAQLHKININSNMDSITGVYNMTYFEELFPLVLTLDASKQLQTGLIMVDIDNFASINESYGRTVGDRVLSSVAYLVRNVMPSSENVMLFRREGDSFVILLKDCNEDQLELCKDLILQSIREFNINRFYEGKPTVSLGGVLSGECCQPREDMLAIALSRLEKAKSAGKNQGMLA